MARKGITQAQVFNAADAISAAGQNPTVASTRAKLGTGSFTTITAHLRAWKEQVITSKPETSDVPEEVTAALGRAAEIVSKTGPKAKRTARTTSEPVTDTVTKPLEL